MAESSSSSSPAEIRIIQRRPRRGGGGGRRGLPLQKERQAIGLRWMMLQLFLLSLLVRRISSASSSCGSCTSSAAFLRHHHHHHGYYYRRAAGTGGDCCKPSSVTTATTTITSEHQERRIQQQRRQQQYRRKGGPVHHLPRVSYCSNGDTASSVVLLRMTTTTNGNDVVVAGDGDDGDGDATITTATGTTKRISSTSSVSASSSSSSSSSSVVDAELLQRLDDAFDYRGRLPSSGSRSRDTPPVPPPEDDDGATSGADDDSETSDEHDPPHPPPFRCGFVCIMGAPNMGKSTLLNALLEEPLCIATPRPQTTRHAITGILSSPNSQVCLVDTPGILEDAPAYTLQEYMMNAVRTAFSDADAYVMVTDIFQTTFPTTRTTTTTATSSGHHHVEEEGVDLFAELQAKARTKPVIIVVNKVDLADKALAKRQREEGKRQQRSSSERAAAPAAEEEAELDGKQETTDNNRNMSASSSSTPQGIIEEAILTWRRWIPDAVAIVPVTALFPPTTGENNNNDGNNDDKTEALLSTEHAGVTALRSLLTACNTTQFVRALSALSSTSGGKDGRRSSLPGMFPDNSPYLGLLQQCAEEATTATAAKTTMGTRMPCLLPVSPPLYDAELFTDCTERFVASEMIRAALLESLRKELPYSCEVRVEQFKRKEKQQKRKQKQKANGNNSRKQKLERTTTAPLLRIAANVLVERESQKKIVIGRGGEQVKLVGTRARRLLEDFFQTQVYLELKVKVSKDWRKNKDLLKKYGYNNKQQ